jgi:hypothetical protein
MVEWMLQLELTREKLGKKMLSIVGGNHYHFVGTVLALIFASGTLGTAFVSAPATVPVGGFLLVAFWAAGIVTILTIVLAPLGLILLQR